MEFRFYHDKKYSYFGFYKSILSKWNSEYDYISKEFSENKQPSDEDLEKIEEYKKNGWI